MSVLVSGSNFRSVTRGTCLMQMATFIGDALLVSRSATDGLAPCMCPGDRPTVTLSSTGALREGGAVGDRILAGFLSIVNHLGNGREYRRRPLSCFRLSSLRFYATRARLSDNAHRRQMCPGGCLSVHFCRGGIGHESD